MQHSAIHQGTSSAGAADVRVSVVIPVKDDARLLDRSLRDLAGQTRPPDEVIVVDNASSDDTAAVAARYGARVVFEARAGIPAAAATGYDAATGDVLLRCDADCRLPADWIARAVRAFDDPRVAAVTGTARFSDLPPRARRFSRLLSGLYLGAYRVGTGIALGHVPLFGSNLGIRTTAWKAVRGSVHRDDPELHDDLDLSIHLGSRQRILFDPDLVVGISWRPFQKGGDVRRRFRRGFHTIVLHWPAELPPYRLARRLRRGA